MKAELLSLQRYNLTAGELKYGFLKQYTGFYSTPRRQPNQYFQEVGTTAATFYCGVSLTGL